MKTRGGRSRFSTVNDLYPYSLSRRREGFVVASSDEWPDDGWGEEHADGQVKREAYLFGGLDSAGEGHGVDYHG